jgi:glycerophosphoryl diester phosphodiesterase
MLEIKAPGIAAELYRAVQAAGFVGRVVYASFLHAEILAIRRMDAAAETLALLEGVPVSGAAFAVEAGATLVGLGLDSAVPGFVAELHAAGVGVWVYTLNEPRMIARAIAAGVDGVISDYPVLIQGR